MHQWEHPTNDRSFCSHFRLSEKAPKKLPYMIRSEKNLSSFQAEYIPGGKNVGCPTARFAPNKNA